MSGNTQFGRKYQLQIKGPASAGSQTVYTVTDSAWEPEALRITFDVDTRWWSIYWTAQIEIFNPSSKLSNFLLTQGGGSSTTAQPPPIQQGMEVVLSAGYQNGGKYGVIFDGFVLQPKFERRNQTDFVVTLNCVIGLNQDARNSIGATPGSGVFAAEATQDRIVAAMAKNAYHPIGVSANPLPTVLGNKKLPRGYVAFGTPRERFNEIARDNNVSWWLDQRGVYNMVDLNDTVPKTATVYTPQTGIVGTPEQTQFGVDMRLLLDPTVQVKNPPMAVAIDNTVIRQLHRQLGDLSSLGILSQDGTYVVVGARYRGDTRGNEWYTDVTGWLTANEKIAALGAALGAPLGS